MKDITIVLEDRPGTLADLGETLGKANINIEGLCGASCEGEDLINILVEESGKAFNVLERAGFKIREEREVLVIDIREIVKKPGTASVCLEVVLRIRVDGQSLFFVQPPSQVEQTAAFAAEWHGGSVVRIKPPTTRRAPEYGHLTNSSWLWPFPFSCCRRPSCQKPYCRLRCFRLLSCRPWHRSCRIRFDSRSGRSQSL